MASRNIEACMARRKNLDLKMRPIIGIVKRLNAPVAWRGCSLILRSNLGISIARLCGGRVPAISEGRTPGLGERNRMAMIAAGIRNMMEPGTHMMVPANPWSSSGLELHSRGARSYDG